MFVLSFSLVSDDDLLALRDSTGKHAKLLSDMCKFYRDWHVKSDGVYGKARNCDLKHGYEVASFDLKCLLFACFRSVPP